VAQREVDIVIFGAGIAGLWAFNRFTRAGYGVLLLESRFVGGGQSIASQGIIHSGLKYAFAGKINALAQNISAMPDLWRAALRGEGLVDLSQARVNAGSQYLLVPGGLMGGLVGLVAKKALGQAVRDVPEKEWPQEIKNSGYHGKLIYMDEPVLDAPGVIRALAAPYADRIRLIDTPEDPFGFLERHAIRARHVVFTGAASNAAIAAQAGHAAGLEVQHRPLLMGMMKNAPFDIYAHMVGHSDKPVATITTHRTEDGSRVWYLGGAVAERAKDSDPREVYSAAKAAFSKYFPSVDFSGAQWAALPVDRVEGRSSTDGWMPDTPTIHSVGNVHYCWPTKLTFAPLLAERLAEKITGAPGGTKADWGFIPPAPLARAPWDDAKWVKHDG
jgi:glycine/D-amino acid oxidase-like deaminating enzyme